MFNDTLVAGMAVYAAVVLWMGVLSAIRIFGKPDIKQ
jgi:hypothetical protein